MRLPLLLALILSAAINITAAEPTNYTLDVQFKNIPDSVRFTLGSDDATYKQKVFTSDNRLHFALDIAEDYPVRFYLIGKNPADPKNDYFHTYIYGMKGLNQTITSSADGFSTDSITYAGAPWDKSTNEWRAFSNANYHRNMKLNEEHEKLMAPFRGNNFKQLSTVDSITITKLNAINQERSTAKNEYQTKVHEYILTHPESPDALHLFRDLYKYFTQDEINTIASLIPDYMNGSPELAMFNRIKSLQRITVGDPLDDFNLIGEDFDGSKISLSQFTTPYILVEFSALGCGPCRSAAKYDLPDLIEKFGNEVTFVSYSTDEKREMMERTHKLDNATWHSIWNGKGPHGDDCVKYGVTGYPHFFLFGPDCTLVATWTGWGPQRFQMEYLKATRPSDEMRPAF